MAGDETRRPGTSKSPARRPGRRRDAGGLLPLPADAAPRPGRGRQLGGVRRALGPRLEPARLRHPAAPHVRAMAAGAARPGAAAPLGPGEGSRALASARARARSGWPRAADLALATVVAARVRHD